MESRDLGFYNGRRLWQQDQAIVAGAGEAAGLGAVVGVGEIAGRGGDGAGEGVPNGRECGTPLDLIAGGGWTGPIEDDAGWRIGDVTDGRRVGGNAG